MPSSVARDGARSHADAPARADGGPGADKPDHMRSVRGALCAASGYEAFLTLRDVLYAVDADADGRVTAVEVEVALRECGVSALNGNGARGHSPFSASMTPIPSRRSTCSSRYARQAASATFGVTSVALLRLTCTQGWRLQHLGQAWSRCASSNKRLKRLAPRGADLCGSRGCPYRAAARTLQRPRGGADQSGRLRELLQPQSSGIDDDAFYAQMLTESYPPSRRGLGISGEQADSSSRWRAARKERVCHGPTEQPGARTARR